MANPTMFQINQPVPYTYREFDRILHKPDGSTCVVTNTEEKEAALKKGWLLAPPVVDEEAAKAAPTAIDLLSDGVPAKAKPAKAKPAKA